MIVSQHPHHEDTAVTTAVDNWPACARLLAGRYGGPLTHSSYTTTWGTTIEEERAAA
jgi:hypothetical protein